MTLTPEQKHWASKKRQGCSAVELERLLILHDGKCAISGVDMIFDLESGTPIQGGRGCHPLYPAVDHIDPGNARGGYQLICYALNDLKGHLPLDCFLALKETSAWKDLMSKWEIQAIKDNSDRNAFKRLLRPNAE